MNGFRTAIVCDDGRRQFDVASLIRSGITHARRQHPIAPAWRSVGVVFGIGPPAAKDLCVAFDINPEAKWDE